MPRLFESTADNIVDRINRHKGVFVHVKDNALELVDLKARDDAIKNFFALTGVTAFLINF